MVESQSKLDKEKSSSTSELSTHSHEEHSHNGCCAEHKKIGRNDPCACGSGKKYKKCCLHN